MQHYSTRDGIVSKCVCVFYFSALVKLLNKSIEGTADDDEEGVTPDTAIRSGLELLKVTTGVWLRSLLTDLMVG